MTNTLCGGYLQYHYLYQYYHYLVGCACVLEAHVLQIIRLGVQILQLVGLVGNRVDELEAVHLGGPVLLLGVGGGGGVVDSGRGFGWGLAKVGDLGGRVSGRGVGEVRENTNRRSKLRLFLA